jgi:alkylmercury lyase
MAELKIRTSYDPAWQAQGSAARQAGLADGLRRLHQAILGYFLEAGGPPGRSWLDDTAARLGLDPAGARAGLAAADLMHVNGDSGRVQVAYPFSGVPSGHRVRLSGGREVWAMCAVDALGIPQMTGCDATITAADPHAGDPVRVSSRGGTWHWSPPSALVLWAYPSAGEHAALCSCPHVSFVTSPGHAQAYLASHPELTGHLIGQPAAVELARALFGPLLSPLPAATFDPGTQGSQGSRQATP